MIISSKKYACETCIKGHRSSSCKHFDRPLFEIKKKGRPVTQCEHCRELRKTKQVHVKCICEVKSDKSKQGNKPGFESAAFPNGLPPQVMETSVAVQNHSEKPSPTSTGEDSASSCSCQAGSDTCQCCTLRKQTSKARNKKGALEGSSHDASGPRQSSQILARIAELRPVLPRPAMNATGHQASMGGPHPHIRHHENVYSPYGRAYGMTHQHPLHAQPFSSSPLALPSPDAVGRGHEGRNRRQSLDSIPHSFNPEEGSSTNVPSACGCGDGCQCPGCIHHNGSAGVAFPSAYPTCMNPESCGTCLDCTILSLQPLIPADTALSISNSSPMDSIDEWLRQITSQISDSVSMPNSFDDFSNSFSNTQFPAFPWQFDGSSSDATPAPALSDRADIGGYAGVYAGDGGEVPFTQPYRSTRSYSHGSAYDQPYLDLQPFRQHIDFSSYVELMEGRSRSRSLSTSSQSSAQDSHDASRAVGRIRDQAQVPYRPSGRVQGLFGNAQGIRSAPQLNLSLARQRSPSSVSPLPTQPEYVMNGQESENSPYDPSLDGLHIY